MTDQDQSRPSVVDIVQVRIGRPGYVVALAGMCAGTLMFLAGSTGASATLMSGIVCLLITLPGLNVLAILLEEVRRRDWVFAALCAAVLALVLINVAMRV